VKRPWNIAPPVSFGGLGIACLRGAEVDKVNKDPDQETALLAKRLTTAVHRLNPELAAGTVEQVVRTVQRPPHPTLIENNRWLHGLADRWSRKLSIATQQRGRFGAGGHGWWISTAWPTTTSSWCAN